MEWTHEASYFLGAGFVTNAIPHFVSGLMGRAFQSPFAKPPGQGLSSSTVNAMWGWFNLVVGYLLIFRVGVFDIRSAADACAVGLGSLALATMTARRFGRFNGGNAAAAHG